MPELLKITTPVLNKADPQVTKQLQDPNAAFNLPDVQKVAKPATQGEILKQNNGMLQGDEAPAILMNLLKDPSVTVGFLKNIFMLQEIIQLLPVNNTALTQDIQQLFDALLIQPEEIAAEMSMPVERVREILKISQEPVSLETPIGEEEDSHLGDFIQDDNVPVPADAAAFTLLKEQLEEVLGTLTEREQKVLTLRFGLEDGRARTLEEVGKEFNVTRERIRQIEAKALRKLRHPSRSRKLKDYLE